MRETDPDDAKVRAERTAQEKAEAEANEAREKARRAAADADKARTDADTAAAVLAERDTPAARRQRAAEAEQATAEAGKAAAAARRDQWSAAIPDLSTLKESALEEGEGPAIGGTLLSFGALEKVAEAIAARIGKVDPAPQRVLVTSSEDLASVDAVYHDVWSALTELKSTAVDVIDKTAPRGEFEAQFTGPLDAAAVLAGAVPQVLSLLTAQRSLKTAAVTVGDLSAAAAVAGAIRAKHPMIAVMHDDFRVLPESRIHRLASEIGTERTRLLARKIELSELKERAEAEKSEVDGQLKDVNKQISDAGKSVPQDLLDKRSELISRSAGLEEKAANAGVMLALVESIIASIDTFLSAIRVIPEGARRSPLATAALYEQLHDTSGTETTPAGAGQGENSHSAQDRLTHVLLVKTQGGQSQQLLENRPLFFKDKYATVVDVSITYMLVSTEGSWLDSAGTVTGSARAYGEIGEMPRISIAEIA